MSKDEMSPVNLSKKHRLLTVHISLMQFSVYMFYDDNKESRMWQL